MDLGERLAGLDWQALASLAGALLATAATLWAVRISGNGRRSSILADLEILRNYPTEGPPDLREDLQKGVNNAISRHADHLSLEGRRRTWWIVSGVIAACVLAVVVVAAMPVFESDRAAVADRIVVGVVVVAGIVAALLSYPRKPSSKSKKADK